MTIAVAALYALFLWWFATGLALMLVLRVRRRSPLVVGAALVFALSLGILAATSRQSTLEATYVAFTATIVLWGTQEIVFLSGAVTGPRPDACPPGAKGFDRFCFALCAILYHEIALVVAGAALIVATWGASNQMAAMTFAVLWVMRLSAKLNLFLGVPVLNDEMLPPRIGFIRSYFRRAPATLFLPISLLVSLLFAWQLTAAAIAATPGTADGAADALVAVLLALAIVEHLFMLLPLPIDRLWRWSRGRSAGLPPLGSPRKSNSIASS